MGNNRIRKAGFLNQNFLCATNPRKTFFAPVPKIFLQQYLPKADILRCGKVATYSITSSARASTLVGILRPSAFAVLRLISSSYLVGA
jgi:hypothetical protein